jgi:hypothetical protein
MGARSRSFSSIVRSRSNRDDVGLVHALAGPLKPVGAERTGSAGALYAEQPVAYAVCKDALDQH